MTFSILVREPESGAVGGAAATGNLCVGGWVLRGDVRAGMTASQGVAPSPFWGSDALAFMRGGKDAAEAVRGVVEADSGAASRQFAALDLKGGTGVHNGSQNHPWCGHVAASDLVVAGNWLTSAEVMQAVAEAFTSHAGPLAERLMAALAAGAARGGDARGLMSAALQVHAPTEPPLDLRIDHAEDPLGALCALYGRTQAAEYRRWLSVVPTLAEPERGA